MEAKQQSTYMESLKVSLNYAKGFYVDPINLSGGLSLWWLNAVPISIICHSKNYIHAVVNFNREYYITFVYAPCILVDRIRVWNEISNLRGVGTEPWIITGDHNAIRYSYEKEGGNGINHQAAAAFNKFITDNNLLDLGYQGDPFTWYNGQRGSNEIKVRLDRGLANPAWRLLFDKALIFHEGKIGSNHRPLRLNFQGHRNNTKCPFRFDASWLSDPECSEIVLNNYNTTTACDDFLKVSSTDLRRWAKARNPYQQLRVDKIKRRMEEICTLVRSDNIIQEECSLLQELDDIWRNEEIRWKQRSNIKWLAAGDRNTLFFHTSVIHRRQRNKISHLQEDNGNWIHSERELTRHNNNYFQNLFTRRQVALNEHDFWDIPSIVTDEMNNALIQEITDDEIRIAVFSLGAGQSPGPDGFPGHFYQKFWTSIGVRFCKEIREFFGTANMPTNWNDTHLVLIPKVANPISMTNFRPISCCNFRYKVI
ncbi:Transposon TX1 uncharacterized 149 kDa protein [Linum perenne]